MVEFFRLRLPLYFLSFLLFKIPIWGVRRNSSDFSFAGRQSQHIALQVLNATPVA